MAQAADLAARARTPLAHHGGGSAMGAAIPLDGYAHAGNIRLTATVSTMTLDHERGGGD